VLLLELDVLVDPEELVVLEELAEVVELVVSPPPVPEPPPPVAVPDDPELPLLVILDVPAPPLPVGEPVNPLPQPYANAVAMAPDAPRKSQDLMRTSSVHEAIAVSRLTQEISSPLHHPALRDCTEVHQHARGQRVLLTDPVVGYLIMDLHQDVSAEVPRSRPASAPASFLPSRGPSARPPR
jgi:hypothetical protein